MAEELIQLEGKPNNYELRVLSYNTINKVVRVEFIPPYIYSQDGKPPETHRTANLKKKTLAYVLGLKEGDRMRVAEGAVHKYFSDRLNEYFTELFDRKL
ncbi:hypothetical protein HY450_02600 [Candidatus Pacearchaeota archaeon]|nr:hypothetical protein [Candidatus Pacearchaeota archaeon]